MSSEQLDLFREQAREEEKRRVAELQREQQEQFIRDQQARQTELNMQNYPNTHGP